ncbi:hypothetical protein IMZ48_37620 [Candidatus Bathyarchaeota archaeon]|nr:hypothetical protein [Candidatus Bathyarchaeota archaeon]
MTLSSFGDREYWDERYVKRPEDFDWLLPATCMDNAIVRALESSKRPEPPARCRVPLAVGGQGVRGGCGRILCRAVEE